MLPALVETPTAGGELSRAKSPLEAGDWSEATSGAAKRKPLTRGTGTVHHFSYFVPESGLRPFAKAAAGRSLFKHRVFGG